jgi:hypothetical protein
MSTSSSSQMLKRLFLLIGLKLRGVEVSHFRMHSLIMQVPLLARMLERHGPEGLWITIQSLNYNGLAALKSAK